MHFFSFTTIKPTLQRVLLLCAVQLFFFSSCDEIDRIRTQRVIDKPLVRQADTLLNNYAKAIQPLADSAELLRCQLVEQLFSSSPKVDSATVYALAAIEQKQWEVYAKPELIAQAHALLDNDDKLRPEQIIALNKLLFNYQRNFADSAAQFKARILAELKLMGEIFGSDYNRNSYAVVDSILASSNSLGQRRQLYQAIGRRAKPRSNALQEVVSTRNQAAISAGYTNYYHYRLHNLGITPEQLEEERKQIVSRLRPLYLEVMRFAANELGNAYGTGAPDTLPRYWFPLNTTDGWDELAVDANFRPARGVIKLNTLEQKQQGAYYLSSIGFPSADSTSTSCNFFNSRYKSVQPIVTANGISFSNYSSRFEFEHGWQAQHLADQTSNIQHEYSWFARPDAATRAAFQEFIILGAAKRGYLRGQGLVNSRVLKDNSLYYMHNALRHLVGAMYYLAVVTPFEEKLYQATTDPKQLDNYWQQLWVQNMQIAIEDSTNSLLTYTMEPMLIADPLSAYEQGMGYLAAYQLNQELFRNFYSSADTNKMVQDVDYFGQTRTGYYLASMLYQNEGRDWREILREKGGGEINATAISDYYDTLIVSINERNRFVADSLERARIEAAAKAEAERRYRRYQDSIARIRYIDSMERVEAIEQQQEIERPRVPVITPQISRPKTSPLPRRSVPDSLLYN
jgi:hypothetical protein